MVQSPLSREGCKWHVEKLKAWTATQKIKPVILIVTEGSQTEPKYFEHYRNRQTNIDIRVVGSRTSGGETDYLSLIRKAVEYQNKIRFPYQRETLYG